MVERGSLPTAGRMALGAGLAELPIVLVVRLVTGVTILRCPRVLIARMA